MKENLRSIVITKAKDLKVGQEIVISKSRFPVRERYSTFGKGNFYHLQIRQFLPRGSRVYICGYPREDPTFLVQILVKFIDQFMVVYEAEL